MEDQVYTLGVWHVKERHEAEFIAAWKDLGRIFASLPQPPSNKGLLIQSTTDQTLFYSFGPWRRSEDVAAMRADPSAQAGIKRIRELCIEATPGYVSRRCGVGVEAGGGPGSDPPEGARLHEPPNKRLHPTAGGL